MKKILSVKFKALKITAGFLEGLGILVVIFGFLLAYKSESSMPILLGIGFGVYLIVGGFLMVILGEVIYLFLSIEFNTSEQKNIMLAQLNILSCIAHKSDVPLEHINSITKDFGLEFKE